MLQGITNVICPGGGALRDVSIAIPSHPRKEKESIRMSDADLDNTLILETSKGPVTIKMRPDVAPGHVDRIKDLVREGFYNGLKFHRVIDGFMAQTGCPFGTGTGGSPKGHLSAEFSSVPYKRGTVGMARAQDPNSASSQFFIMFADGSFLNGKYTVWGEVTDGMENVDKITRGEPPAHPDTIVKARMAGDAA
jgi:peptidylprolyl isomerase